MISNNNALWFAIRRDKLSRDGKAPIIMFYSLNDMRLKYSTRLKINPFYWCAESKMATYIKPDDAKRNFKAENIPFTTADLLTKSEIDNLNNELSLIRRSVDAIVTRFEVNAIPYSAKTVLEELKEFGADVLKAKIKVEEKPGLLYDFMDQYIADHEATREKGSLSVYKSVKNHLQAYEKATGHRVAFESIDYNFFNRLQTFLINKKKPDGSHQLNNTTIAKALSTLKTFLGYARKQDIKVNQGYRDFPIKKQKLEVIALEQDELDALLNLDLTKNKRLDKTRDLFCFACATGLRYSDVAMLKRENIYSDALTVTIKKTKELLTVPLNEISYSILEKYKEHANPLPVISNQKLNVYIKEVCELAGINRPIEIVRYVGVKKVVNVYPKYELCHFHLGRKTFVTLSLEKGMTSEEVMRTTGHQDYKSFEKYVSVTEKRKKVVMTKAWGEIKRLKVV